MNRELFLINFPIMCVICYIMCRTFLLEQYSLANPAKEWSKLLYGQDCKRQFIGIIPDSTAVGTHILHLQFVFGSYRVLFISSDSVSASLFFRLNRWITLVSDQCAMNYYKIIHFMDTFIRWITVIVSKLPPICFRYPE